MSNAVVLDIQQRTPEWHEWRRRVIGASEVGALLGRSPWLTPRELWEVKTGRREVAETAAMARGRDLEEAARFAAEVEIGCDLVPGECIEQPELRLGASLDARAPGAVVELKCPASITSFERMRESVPEHYADQVRAQVWLAAEAGLPVERGLLVAWHPEAGVAVHEIAAPDDEWKERVAEASRAFWQAVEAGAWPEDDLAMLVAALAAAKAEEAEAKAARQRIEAELVAAMQARGAKKIETLAGLKATLTRRKVVDKDALEADPEWQAIMERLKPLEEQKKEIEARHRVLGAPYIRISGGAR